MTRKQSLYFSFAGEDSRKYGIIQVHTSSGLYEEGFIPNRNIIEEKIAGRDEPYLFGVDTSPLEDSITIYTENDLTDEQINELSEWLLRDYYEPLIFEDNPEKIYYAMFIGDSQIVHNGAKQGYFTLQYRCNSCYAFSPVYTKSVYIDSNTIAEDVEIGIKGNHKNKPVINIKKKGNGDISIINTSNGGIETKVTGLIDTEELKIDCYNKEIETNLINTYRYENFNRNYLELVKGVNRLKIKGAGLFEIQYYYKFNS